jgi:protein SCO1/2
LQTIDPLARRVAVGLLTGALMLVPSASLWAHGNETHDTPPALVDDGSAAVENQTALTPFPVALGGPFALTDHTGARRASADFEGRFPIIFFGYARCESICPVALKHMVDALDILGMEGERLVPLLITIDPENETPEVLAEEVPKLHPRLIGLTGSPEEIAAVRASFRVDVERVGTGLKGNPVFAHGSFIYLMGPDGSFLTLFPPILNGEVLAEKLRAYLL